MIDSNRFLLLAATMLCLPNIGNSEEISLSEEKLQEELKPSATISGLLVLGAIRQSAAFTDHVVMTASLPQDWQGKEMCISLISADGLYEARNTYRIGSDWAGGVADIPYPTEYADRLLSLGADDLAISTTAGSCDSSDEAALMPIAWRNTEAAQSTTVSLYANSFGADEVFVYVGDDPSADPVDCTRIETGIRTVFDTVCKLELEGFDLSAPIEVEMIRISDGNMSPSEFVELDLRG